MAFVFEYFSQHNIFLKVRLMRFKQFFILIVLDQLTRGVGRISRVDGFFLPLPYHQKDQNIMRDLTYLVLISDVLALELWGHHLHNNKVSLREDNFSLDSVINQQSSIKSGLLNQLDISCLDSCCIMSYLRLNTQVVLTITLQTQWQQFRSQQQQQTLFQNQYQNNLSA